MKSGCLPRRRDLAVFCVMLLVGWVAFGPPKAVAEPVDKTALLAELMKLEAASWQYLKDTNVLAVNKYLADDAVLIFGNGIHFTKAEYVKAMPSIRLDSFTIEPNAEIKVWTPGVATLLYRITYTSAMKDADASTIKVLSSSTYLRSNGNWVERDLSGDTDAVIGLKAAPQGQAHKVEKMGDGRFMAYWKGRPSRR